MFAPRCVHLSQRQPGQRLVHLLREGETAVEALARLTLAEVNAAWRKHIDPQRLVMAWGGDFKLP